MSKRLEGKVALITGTASGQGAASAIQFAQEGALVIGCDLNETGNRETVAAVQAAGGTMTGMAPVDLGDPDQAKAWVDEAAAVHGRIDVVFNNASDPKFALMSEMSVQDWQYTIRNELDLVFYVTRVRVAVPVRARRRRHQHGVDLGARRHPRRRDGGALRDQGWRPGDVASLRRRRSEARHPCGDDQPRSDQDARGDQRLLPHPRRRGCCDRSAAHRPGRHIGGHRRARGVRGVR